MLVSDIEKVRRTTDHRCGAELREMNYGRRDNNGGEMKTISENNRGRGFFRLMGEIGKKNVCRMVGTGDGLIEFDRICFIFYAF